MTTRCGAPLSFDGADSTAASTRTEKLDEGTCEQVPEPTPPEAVCAMPPLYDKLFSMTPTPITPQKHLPKSRNSALLAMEIKERLNHDVIFPRAPQYPDAAPLGNQVHRTP
jgi:hypothetical protein